MPIPPFRRMWELAILQTYNIFLILMARVLTWILPTPLPKSRCRALISSEEEEADKRHQQMPTDLPEITNGIVTGVSSGVGSCIGAVLAVVLTKAWGAMLMASCKSGRCVSEKVLPQRGLAFPVESGPASQQMGTFGRFRVNQTLPLEKTRRVPMSNPVFRGRSRHG